jgi:hypothetical protein
VAREASLGCFLECCLQCGQLHPVRRELVTFNGHAVVVATCVYMKPGAFTLSNRKADIVLKGGPDGEDAYPD